MKRELIVFEEPEKVLLKLASPVIIANGLQTLYNFMDAFWISLLRNARSSLAGIGLIMPFAFSLIALSSGIGIGTNSVISRLIGKGDREEASATANTGILLAITVGIVLTFILFFTLPYLLRLMLSSKSEGFKEALIYGRILVIGAPFLFLSTLLSFLLRAEGDMKRSMIAIGTGTVLNILLDPVFIFGFKLGIKGAAISTVIARTMSLFPLFYWIFKKRTTYIKPCLKRLNLNSQRVVAILKVGIPASLSLLFLSVGVFLFNSLIARVSGSSGITVYITGNRINSLAVLPALGIQAAVITLSGVWWGAKRKDMIKRTFIHAFKLGLLMEGSIGLMIFFFSPYLARVFASSRQMIALVPEIVVYLKIAVLGYPFMLVSMFSSGVFNGIGKSRYALLLTLSRILLIAYPLAWFYSTLLGLGLKGIWLGTLSGVIGASLIGIMLLKRFRLI